MGVRYRDVTRLVTRANSHLLLERPRIRNSWVLLALIAVPARVLLGLLAVLTVLLNDATLDFVLVL